MHDDAQESKHVQRVDKQFPRSHNQDFMALQPPPIEVQNTLSETDFTELKLYARGKVRDLYNVSDQLLLVATDRISAFDHVL